MIPIAVVLFTIASVDEAPCRPAVDAATGAELAPQLHGTGLWIGGVSFGPDDIVSAQVKPDKYTSAATIVLTFTPAGQRKFAIAQRCGPNVQIDVWIDDDLIANPYLMTLITGPVAVIAGNWTWSEAQTIARRISPRSAPTRA